MVPRRTPTTTMKKPPNGFSTFAMPLKPWRPNFLLCRCHISKLGFFFIINYYLGLFWRLGIVGYRRLSLFFITCCLGIWFAAASVSEFEIWVVVLVRYGSFVAYQLFLFILVDNQMPINSIFVTKVVNCTCSSSVTPVVNCHHRYVQCICSLCAWGASWIEKIPPYIFFHAFKGLYTNEWIHLFISFMQTLENNK